MHILVVTGIFPPDIGGPASFVPAIAQSLSDRGHTLRVITLSDRVGHDDTCYPFSVKRIRRGIPRPLRMLRTIAFIAACGKQADVLFVHGLALESVIANAWLRKPLVQKVVGDLAWERARTQGLTTDSLEAFQQTVYGPRIEALKALRCLWTRKSSRIITPSCYLQRIVEGWGVDAEAVAVIYNAVSAPSERGVVDRACRRHDGTRIVSVGRLVSWKGFADLIRAAVSLPNAQLRIVGDGPERQRLETLAGNLHAADRTVFRGTRSRQEVFQELQQADVFVLNSSYEGLPHIVLEAMAAGTPVVATNTGGTAELVSDGRSGLLVPVGDPGSLRSAIERIVSEQNLAENLIRGGQETVEHFSWDRLVDETLQVLSDAAEAKSMPESGSPAGLPTALFVSSERIGCPPDPTQQKKWQGISRVLQATVIAFRQGSGETACAGQGCRWLLLAQHRSRFVRYLTHFVVSVREALTGAVSKKYRTIIAQSPFEALAPAVALLPWKLAGAASRPRLIVEIHSDWKDGVMLYHRGRFSGFEHALRRAVGAFSLGQADAFRVISGYCRELLPRSQKPVFVFPTFTDLESFQAPARELLDTVQKKYGSGYFLYAGMLIHLKGVHHLLSAMTPVADRYPDARLIIAGSGSDESRLKQQAGQSGLSERVCFTGRVDQDMLAALMQNALAFVMPSLTEGLGRVALEAHLLGRPVVASRVGGIPEIVQDNVSGILCEPGDEQALAGALISLLEDPGRATRMGAAGRESARRFDYSGFFDAYRDMVEKTCRS